jgi:glycosyltransferase involved in cell wall biosynthesis
MVRIDMNARQRSAHLDEAGEALYEPTADEPSSTNTASLRVHMTGAEWFSAHPGGLNRYFTDLYGALRSHPGVSVSAAAFGECGPGARSWGPIGGSTLRRARTAFFDLADLPRGAVLDRHFCLYGRPRMGARGKHPLIVHFHGPWAAESRFTGASKASALAKHSVERLRYSGADRFVVLSEHFRNVLAEDYGIRGSKIVVIPPGVDLHRFQVAREPRDQMVLCVRRLERRMGIDVLIRGWRAVTAEHPDARLVIVGTGTEERSLRALAHESGLAASISFEGRASDTRLAALYQQAALTVIPSVALEGFGLAALESLAAGRAPIVTDCGGLPDAVVDLDLSLVVPAGNADAVGDRVADALYGDIPDAARCRTHAESFSWEAAAQRHVEMCEELS